MFNVKWNFDHRHLTSLIQKSHKKCFHRKNVLSLSFEHVPWLCTHMRYEQVNLHVNKHYINRKNVCWSLLVVIVYEIVCVLEISWFMFIIVYVYCCHIFPQLDTIANITVWNEPLHMCCSSLLITRSDFASNLNRYVIRKCSNNSVHFHKSHNRLAAVKCTLKCKINRRMRRGAYSFLFEFYLSVELR